MNPCTPGPRGPLHVVVVDNLETTRRGLQSLAMSNPEEIASVRAVADPSELDLTEPGPDVVLLDYWLGRESTPALPWIAALRPWTAHLLLHTSEERPHVLQEAVRAGVEGVCLKTEPLETLVQVLRDLRHHRMALGTPVARTLLREESLTARLTPAEIGTLRALSLGLSAREVAASRHVEVSTVNTHIETIRAKYSATLGEKVNRTRMLEVARADGVIDPRF